MIYPAAISAWGNGFCWGFAIGLIGGCTATAIVMLL